MSTLQDSIAVDAAKLDQFVFRAVDEVGATLNAALTPPAASSTVDTAVPAAIERSRAPAR